MLREKVRYYIYLDMIVPVCGYRPRQEHINYHYVPRHSIRPVKRRLKNTAVNNICKGHDRHNCDKYDDHYPQDLDYPVADVVKNFQRLQSITPP